MNIAIGNSRMEKKWKNKDISWDDFCSRVSQTMRTTESVSEYRQLGKGKQDDIKDVGGFVGGTLKEGKRRNGNVLNRSILTLDMDYAIPDIWETITALFDWQCCLYSTHKHTPENPRLRLIISLSREVSEDEYPAVGRMVAKDIGIDLFDDSTYEPARLMYWPSTPSNGEFVFHKNDGNPLDPDKYLSRFKDWHDASTWPVSSRQSEVVKHSVSQQQDPLAKEGIVGAFCRAYTIEDVIDTFLSDIYGQSVMEGRYDYIPADSTAGVVLYAGKFAYSNHATDPAYGRLLNAFDLVRLHKFRDLDEGSKDDTPIGKLPSFKAMQDLASKDENVKMVLSDERRIEASTEFNSTDDWQKQLELDRSGNVQDSLNNLVLILNNDEKLHNIAFNLHRDGMDAKDGLPWEQIKDGWNDSDNASLKVYLSRVYGLYTPMKTKDAVLAVATSRAYHPIKQYLDVLPVWDGIQRVDSLLVDYFGAEDSSYTKATIRKTLVAAVSRIYHPGTKFDSVLILNGPQGIGKSTFFEKLAGSWFSDSLSLTDMRDKSGPEKLQGYWILELGELAGMRKADVETVKSFISRVDDKYRASYGLNVESHPRQCVIVGSTNTESGFLRDITGNRRFWPVKIYGFGKKKPWQITRLEVQQIWAETLELYRKGEKLYLEGDVAQIAISEQADAMETDDREGLVRAYLDTLLPIEWDSMSLFERKNFLHGSEFGAIEHKGSQKRQLICNMEIWCECFGKEPSSLKRSDSYEISSIMRKVDGWEKYNGTKTGSFPFYIYGNQRALMRKQEKQE